MKQQRETTIYTIALHLGISPATVSRGLNNHASISEQTKKRIHKAAQKLGYRHNNFASSLRKQRTHTIGVMVHELNSYFITAVLAGIEQVTAQHGYDLIIAHSSESFLKEKANALNLFHKRVDGLIASLAFDTTNLQHFEVFRKKKIPVVFFDRVEMESFGTKVVIDNKKAGFDAAEHLIQQGATVIAHITASLTRNVYADRLQGFKKALKKYRLPFQKTYLLVNDFSEAAAKTAAEKIMQLTPRPNGIFITNDFFAALVMQHLREAGLRIPEDIAIAGFNNDVISRMVQPQLTTINYPGKEMGEAAAQKLVKQLAAKSEVMKKEIVVIHSSLIARGSSVKSKRL